MKQRIQEFTSEPPIKTKLANGINVEFSVRLIPASEASPVQFQAIRKVRQMIYKVHIENISNFEKQQRKLKRQI